MPYNEEIYKSKGDVYFMKHTFELKLPKLLDRKLNETPEEEEARVKERDEKLQKAIRIGGPLVIGLTIGYLAGHSRGLTKMHKGDLYVIK